MFSLHCCLNFNFRLSTSNYSYPILLNSLLFCHCTLWHVTFGSLLLFCHLCFTLCNPIISTMACGSINYLVNGQLLPPNSFSVFTYLHSIIHKLSKHIASTPCFVSGQPAVFSWSLSQKKSRLIKLLMIITYCLRRGIVCAFLALSQSPVSGLTAVSSCSLSLPCKSAFPL